jgi:hypothetical protein
MRGDALGNAVNIWIRVWTQLDLGQRWVAASRLSKGTGEQRMASVGADPSRQLLVQMSARICGSPRGRRAVPSVELPTTDQFARDLGRWF